MKGAPKPAARWWLAPFRSRGSFSPRLLMAWVLVLFMLWLIRRWITTPPAVLNGLLVLPPSVAEVVGILAALIAGLLSLGTLQKIKLDAPPPEGNGEQPLADDGTPRTES